MRISDAFQYCPKCGFARESLQSGQAFQCAGCGFLYFFNTATAVGAFVHNQADQWLFIRRKRDPGKGKLAPAGGFVDAGEDAESAVRRELREELAIEVGALDYLHSAPNDYHYRDIIYPVLDLFFVGAIVEGSEPKRSDEVESFIWAKATEIAADDLAFPSMQAAWRRLMGLHKR